MTFRHGTAQAAYLSLHHRQGDVAARSQPMGDGYVVDYAADGRMIGIEITSPTSFSAQTFNALLTKLGQLPLSVQEVRPLAA